MIGFVFKSLSIQKDIYMTHWAESNVQANDINIHYVQTGDASKPPLILLHGITDNGMCWSRVARSLEDSYHVLMLDARGHGQSSGVETGFSLSLLAADVAGFIRALHLNKPFLYGHSMGAVTAAQVAATYPELVRAVILEDPPFMNKQAAKASSDPQRWQWIMDIKALPHDELLRRASVMNPGWGQEELLPWVESKEQFRTEVLQNANTIVDTPWQDIITHIQCPILLITADPESGSIVTPQIAQEVSQLAKHSEVVHISGAGHNIHRDRFEETLAAIRAFCSTYDH